MLPSRFSPTGTYGERVHERTAAFRLLVHAEFESYIEETVTYFAAKRVDQWLTSRVPSVTIAALLAYDPVESKGPTPLTAPPQKPSALLDDRLRAALTRFNTKVRRYNNGVRELDVLGMVLPIGVDSASLDLVWLTDLDGWAQERGDFAHQSSGKLQVKLDPAREYSKVRALLAGFRSLDSEISGLS